MVLAEYMSGGSLYEYLHKNHNTLMLPQLVKFAIDVCKGMEYLHKNNIIHRDLKTANLLMDSQNVSIPRLIFQLLETIILSTANVYI
ncbi:putative non-specific protein-tyrosine kinase TKL-Pl-4 family [Helianthus annuus]|nr:putative non-specific protein-tyrosine kinase TKL-Pl-4 family [Helianthus annuus]